MPRTYAALAEQGDVLAPLVYNIDKTGVMLSMLGSFKVLIDKDNLRGYRGARVKQTIVTAIECISVFQSFLVRI